jgi:hypothetical protein
MDFYCFDVHKWHCCVLFLLGLQGLDYAKLAAGSKGCGKTLLVELLNIAASNCIFITGGKVEIHGNVAFKFIYWFKNRACITSCCAFISLLPF